MDVSLIQRNDAFYLTGPLSIIDVDKVEEVASLDVIDNLRRAAPNNKIMWLSGEYMDSGPNGNKQAWVKEEVAIKSLTPNLMPVTLMHDFRTAVGVIAHTSLHLPDETASLDEPARLSNVVAIWQHRFPEVADEIKENHDAGTLMQSMECAAPMYSCSECGKMHVKPVDPREVCPHIQNGTGWRTLHDVTFTGTGLIFGTRGRTGAHQKAHLELLDEVAEQVAEWSDARAGHTESRNVTDITIPRSEYDDLKAKAAKVAEIEAADAKAREAAEKADEAKAEAEKKVIEKEAEVAALTEERDTLKTQITEFEEKEAQDELASQRLSALPKELGNKLLKAPTAKERTTAKARTATDEDWQAEVAMLAEVFNVDPSKSTETSGDLFDETAMRQFNPNGGSHDDAKTPDPAAVGQGVATMLKSRRNKS